MPVTIGDIARWPALDRAQLAERLRAAIRVHYCNEPFWAVVRACMRDNPVMAGHLRGLLHELTATTSVDGDWWAACVAVVSGWLASHQQSDSATLIPAPATDPPPAGGGRGSRIATPNTPRGSGTAAINPFRVDFRAPPSAARRSGRH